ncbi:MAG: hypothetical protein M1150_01160 [Patescibacteria group bacterium]|nr:hypothetical protein [Patescibacteria group bacterium]
MKRLLLTFSIIFSWFLISFSTLSVSYYFYQKASETKELNSLVKSFISGTHNTYRIYSAAPPSIGDIVTAINSGDARPVLVDRFLKAYGSPMQGLGKTFVEVADKNGLDYRLIPAIAFQESNLGKKIPKGSYNAWGWAIYTGKNSGANFGSWEEAIEKIGQGIKKDYIDKGLKTSKQIMSKYTPNSSGSWAEGVEFAMAEIED